MLTGVALILIASSTGRLLVLKELKDKPIIKKKAGMISFPLETVAPGERKEIAVQRLIFEEIGVEVDADPIFFGGAFSIIEQTQTFAAYAVCDDEFVPTPRDEDVEFYGWLHPRELLCSGNPLRIEVAPIMKAFRVQFK